MSHLIRIAAIAALLPVPSISAQQAVREFPTPPAPGRTVPKLAQVPYRGSAVAAARTGNVPPRTIVADGQPVATIVIRAEPSAREIQAAREIRDYVEKSTGARLDVVSNTDGAKGHVIGIKVQHPDADSARVEELLRHRLQLTRSP